MKKLIVLREMSLGKEHTVELPCVVGRGAEARLSFTDPSVSHRHALIGETAGEIWIEDLNSVNGVFVNGQRIMKRTTVTPRDRILLGSTELAWAETEPEDISQDTVILHSLGAVPVAATDEQRLKLIYDIAAELPETEDMSALGQKILIRLKDLFRQDRGYLALFGEDGSLAPLAVDQTLKSLPVSRSILNRLHGSGESFLLEDALSDYTLKEQASVIALRIRSALCVPLVYHEQIYGVLYLDRGVPGAYGKSDLELLSSIGTIIAPLIENARLWSELKGRYESAVETLRRTESRLIEMERKAAYVRLAQAMAHEIRNPIMVAGGLVRRVARSVNDSVASERLQAVIASVERIEQVLREVDEFVRTPPPQKRLERVDLLIQQAVMNHQEELGDRALRPVVSLETSRPMVPVDASLLNKALLMVFREIAAGAPGTVNFRIAVKDGEGGVEIRLGEVKRRECLCDPYAQGLQGKPWALSLFLSIAHKIVSDHDGRLLLDPEACAALPVVIELPRTLAV
ncbi:MAG: FHA domain-containing protein [Chloroflexota bacterium]